MTDPDKKPLAVSRVGAQGKRPRDRETASGDPRGRDDSRVNPV
jgi:hypothetical protein